MESLQEQLKGVENSLGKAQAQAEGVEKSVLKIEDAVTKAATQVDILDEKMKKAKADFEPILDQAKEVQELVGKCEGQLAEKEDALKAMLSKYQAAKKGMVKTRTVELEAELDDAREERRRAQARGQALGRQARSAA